MMRGRAVPSCAPYINGDNGRLQSRYRHQILRVIGCQTYSTHLEHGNTVYNSRNNSVARHRALSGNYGKFYLFVNNVPLVFLQPLLYLSSKKEDT